MQLKKNNNNNSYGYSETSDSFQNVEKSQILNAYIGIRTIQEKDNKGCYINGTWNNSKLSQKVGNNFPKFGFPI